MRFLPKTDHFSKPLFRHINQFSLTINSLSITVGLCTLLAGIFCLAVAIALPTMAFIMAPVSILLIASGVFSLVSGCVGIINNKMHNAMMKKQEEEQRARDEAKPSYVAMARSLITTPAKTETAEPPKDPASIVLSEPEAVSGGLWDYVPEIPYVSSWFGGT